MLLLVLTIVSCKKLIIEKIETVFTAAGISNDIVISKDTLINGIWNIPATTIVRFESGGHISGSGTINGGIITAPLTQFIFDTTITLLNTRLYNNDFSVMWYGGVVRSKLNKVNGPRPMHQPPWRSPTQNGI